MKTAAPFRRPVLLAVVCTSGGGIFAGGCRQKNEAGRVAAVVEAARQTLPKTLGYVRLVDLTKASPLQADVQRLQDAQKRLVRFDTVPSASQDASVMAGYVLPPLSSSGTGSASQAAAALRQKDARTRLARNVERSLQVFESDARQNNDRRAAQKQSERIAEEEITGADALRRARQTGERETRNQVAGLTDSLAVGRGRNGVLQAQLTPGAAGQDVGLPPVFDQAAFEAEIAKLKADPKALGISERARLELKRRTNQARIDVLEREIRQIVREGTANVGADIARLRAERLVQIKAEIALLKQQGGVGPLVQSERAALGQVLAVESAAANRAQAVAASQGKSSGAAAMAGPVTLDVMTVAGGSGNGGGDVVRARSAVERIRKQQQILQALILADARESIRDNAQIHNVDVVVIEPGAAANAPARAGRRDMTGDFKRWFLSLGTGSLPSENGTSQNENRSSTGTSSRAKLAGKGRA